MAISKETITGKIGEHYVCYRLLREGYIASIAEEGLPYDVTVDLGRHGIKRLQVKNTMKFSPRGIYNYLVKTGGKGNTRRVSIRDIDVLALVAVQIGKIAYFKADHLISEDGKIYASFTLKDKDKLRENLVLPGEIKIKKEKKGWYFQHHEQFPNFFTKI